MRIRAVLSVVGVLTTAAVLWGQEPLDVAATYERIAADYRRVERATRNASATAAMGRATRDAYRLLLLQAKDATDLDAEDLYALGACNEAIAEFDESIKQYLAALAKKDDIRTHLALVRVYSRNDDLESAEKHFSAARELQPEYPNLGEFRNVLAGAHERVLQWSKAAEHLESYLAYAKALEARSPDSQATRRVVASVERRLARVSRFDEMVGAAAPALNVATWIQGEAVKLADLKGKVVIVDTFALLSASSRERIEQLKQVQEKYGEQGVEVIGVTRPLKYRYNAETDRGSFDRELAEEDEAAGILEYAKKHEVGYRLGLAAKKPDDEAGTAMPAATMVVDAEGTVRLVLPVASAKTDVLEETIEQLMK